MRFCQEMSDDGHLGFTYLLNAQDPEALSRWYQAKVKGSWTMPDGTPVHNWRSVLTKYATKFVPKAEGVS